ncbi:MAG: SurA N-terminal domain-containing protein, partial [Proteobacteria bacterium]|nr:SurA N-terminal domain-containing protein [Pseudomonadota bacterium]
MGRNGSQYNTNQIITGTLARTCCKGFCLIFLSTPLLAAEQLLDRLAAEVNGHAITASEVQSKVDKGPLIEVSPWPALENDPPAKVALQDLINKKLIMQKAEELDIQVTDEALKEEIQNYVNAKHIKAGWISTC